MCFDNHIQERQEKSVDSSSYQEVDMRTNIVIDDQLMHEALQVSGYKTKREAVEEGLKLHIAMKKQAKYGISGANYRGREILMQ